MLRGDSIEAAVVTTLSYFDIFACAPRRGELHRFLVGKRASRAELDRTLDESDTLRRLAGERDGFWFLRGKEHLVPRRIRFLEHSRRFWPRAHEIAQLLERSRLASCAMVTGSLAADNSDEHADIDFLLTYPAERAWTSYALVRLLAKLPGIGLAEMCPNYALPEDRLTVRPQNLFTAWEIAKAVPMYGFEVYERFAHENAWVRRYLPNALPSLEGVPIAPAAPRDSKLVRRVTESSIFQTIESAEKRRKFKRDTRDVGVDMDGRHAQGSVDRHTPTRPFQTLSELRYRMELFHLTAHPLFEEIREWTAPLDEEMGRWGQDEIAARREAKRARPQIAVVPSANDR